MLINYDAIQTLVEANAVRGTGLPVGLYWVFGFGLFGIGVAVLNTQHKRIWWRFKDTITGEPSPWFSLMTGNLDDETAQDRIECCQQQFPDREYKIVDVNEKLL